MQIDRSSGPWKSPAAPPCGRRNTMARAAGLALAAVLGLSSGQALAAELAADATETGQPQASESADSVTPAAAQPASASAPEETASRQPAEIFEHLLVTGGAEAVHQVPGAADFLDVRELRRQDHSDIHRVLRQVPGVNIQEEDGYGLRPNIGMRGTGVERSQKVTLLEDGVLIAPAPYAASAAYYFPAVGRMEAVEVEKGSSSIRQGPHTNGGVVNLVSSSIPGRFGGRVNAAAGDHGTLRLHANAGRSGEHFGWLVETYQFDTDGFKELDGGGPTGVRLEDYVAKLRYSSRSDSRFYQALELKLGRTEQAGEETYLGLVEEDFARAPFRRYAASQEDFIDTDHEQFQLRYLAQPGASLTLTATLYRNEFFRNWHKLQSVRGVEISRVLAAPELFFSELALLRGESDETAGGLLIRNNRRDYYSEGAEAILGWRRESAQGEQRFELGVRLHRDAEDRFQEEDRWNLVAGEMELLGLGAPGSQSNRVTRAEAGSVFFRDTISFGRWTLSPGVRFESIDFERLDYRLDDPSRAGDGLETHRNGVDVWIPGIGVNFQAGGGWSLFGGVHKGFSPPGPGRAEQTRPEESVNYELGARFRGRDLSAKAVAFYNDYDNLLGRDTLSSGGDGTGDAFNGGAVRVEGLETALEYDAGRARGWSLGVPLRLTYTYTRGAFRNAFETSFADWSPRVEIGDELPYLPRHQAAAAVGLSATRWNADLSLSHGEAMRTSPGQGAIPAGEGTGSFTVVDLAASYRVLDGLKLFVQVRNLTDETYAAARRPAGLRPGLRRSTLAGLSWDF